MFHLFYLLYLLLDSLTWTFGKDMCVSSILPQGWAPGVRVLSPGHPGSNNLRPGCLSSVLDPSTSRRFMYHEEATMFSRQALVYYIAWHTAQASERSRTIIGFRQPTTIPTNPWEVRASWGGGALLYGTGMAHQ